VFTETLEVETYVEELPATELEPGQVPEEEEAREGFWQKAWRVVRGLLGLGS
jgi:hypothetical protein